MNILFHNTTNVMLSKGDLLISATKPTGEGTGLSLSYDIVKAHGGELKVKTIEGESLPARQTGSEFIIQLTIQI